MSIVMNGSLSGDVCIEQAVEYGYIQPTTDKGWQAGPNCTDKMRSMLQMYTNCPTVTLHAPLWPGMELTLDLDYLLGVIVGSLRLFLFVPGTKIGCGYIKTDKYTVSLEQEAESRLPVVVTRVNIRANNLQDLQDTYIQLRQGKIELDPQYNWAPTSLGESPTGHSPEVKHIRL